MSRFNLHSLLFLLFAMLCSPAVGVGDPEKRTITNDLYSFTLPADWEPYRSKDILSGGIVPLERDSKIFHHYYLLWQRKGKQKFPAETYICIESFRLLNKEPLSVNDIANMKIDGCKQNPLIKDAVVTEQEAKPGQRKYMITKVDTALDATSGNKYYKTREFNLVQKGLDVVHHVSISIRETAYQQSPDVKHMVDEILDSFVVNLKFSSEAHEKAHRQ